MDFIQKEMTQYMKRWNAHGKSLMSDFDLVEQLFLVVAVDERYVGASGCSIDGLISFIRDMGNACSLEFLDRSLITYRDINNQIIHKSRTAFKEYIRIHGNQEIKSVFDITIQRLSDFNCFEKKFGESWHAQAFKI